MYSVSKQVVDRMVNHLREGTTDVAPADLEVPVANFSSEDYARKEREVFRRQMLIVAHSSELPDARSFVTRDILGASYLLVRQTDGSVRALRNMCPHRGGKIEFEAKGSKPAFVCSYHGWSFDREGQLRGVAYKDWYEPMDRSCRSLRQVKCEERHGFVWIDLSDDPGRTVRDYLGEEGDAHLADFDLDKAVIFIERSFTLEVNWKLVIDGALDVIHPAFLHPDGVANFIHSGTAVWMEYGRHGQVFSPRRRLAERVKAGDEVDGGHRYFASNFFVYPNSLLIAAPDHYEVWSVWPSSRSTTETHVTIRLMIERDKLDDEMAERLRRSWGVIEHAAMAEDWPMEVTIQENALADPDGTFVYGRGELSCQHLHRWLERDMAGIAG